MRLPAEQALSILVQIFKGKGDTRNNVFYRLLGHGMKVVERMDIKNFIEY